MASTMEETHPTPTPAGTTPPSVLDGETPMGTDRSFDLSKDEKLDEPSIEGQPRKEANTLDPSSDEFKRPISNFRWFLVSIGLFLGAFLYGMLDRSPSESI